jgi:hypothetical protein
MEAFFAAAFQSLGAAAQSGYALIAYALATAGYVTVVWRVTRNKNLLKKLSDLPEADRIKALRSEMGAIVPDSISPEDWLIARSQSFRFLAYIITVLLVVTLCVLAFLHFQGKLEVTVTEFQSRAGTLAEFENVVADPPEDGLVEASSVVKYKYSVTSSLLSVTPVGPYLERLATHERVEPFRLYGEPISWEFPQLSVKVQNNSKNVVLLSSVEFKVHSVLLNKAPLLLLKGSGYVGRIWIQNEGWGKVLDPTVSLNIKAGEACNSNGDRQDGSGQSIAHRSINLESFDDNQEIDISNIVSKEEQERLKICDNDIEEVCGGRACSWPVHHMKCLDTSVHNDVCQRASPQLSEQDRKRLALFSQPSANEIATAKKTVAKLTAEHASAERIEAIWQHLGFEPGKGPIITLMRRCTDSPVCAIGDLHYKTEDGKADIFLFKTAVFFVRPGFGAPEPPTFRYDVFLESNKNSYSTTLPISQSIKPKDVDHFLLRIASDRSASFDMEVTIKDASERAVWSKHVVLNYFLPSSVTRRQLEAAASEDKFIKGHDGPKGASTWE